MPTNSGRIQAALCEIVTMIWVGSGRLPPRFLNIFSKIGTMKTRTPAIISRLKQMTMTG